MKTTTLLAGACAVLPALAVDWSASEWISAADAPVYRGIVEDGTRAADGTSWFAGSFTNAKPIASAVWTTTGLGVYEAYVNGAVVGNDFLKPGFTHVKKTRRSFAYDVTGLLRRDAGAKNVLAAEVSAGWWRDKIVTPVNPNGFTGMKSAFRGVLEVTYEDGTRAVFGTSPATWRAGTAGAVTHAAIFDGEEYDARNRQPTRGEGLTAPAEPNREFAGEILPSAGAEVTLRHDRAMARGPYTLKKGEALVVDFGQNASAVPFFRFRAKRGTVLTALPAEMLNDADAPARGCDGKKGTIYRANLRVPEAGMRVVYTFSGDGLETYHPRFTFFGYRYLELTATDEVTIESVTSVPVSSIRADLERGRLTTGVPAVNKLIANTYWGQLSNYLSVPTDCPQRNERLGWTADTQVFCEAGSFNADTSRFFHKWMRDMVDSRDADGGFPSVAPFAQYGNETFNLGWADAGVIVPWTVWKQFGDLEIVRENYDAMAKFVRKVDETKYKYDLAYTYADWLSFETFETCGNQFGDWGKWAKDPDAQHYREYLAACYWLYDARLMAEMAAALGKADDVAFFRAAETRAFDYIRATYFESDGLLLKPMRHLQTACVFALKMGLVAGNAKAQTLDILVKSIADHDGCLQTGFLGTGFILEALTSAGRADVAYSLLLNHNHPSWLYSVDQGATTIWERWNSYTKKDGFGPVSMNSFNHYAYGAVIAWIYKTVAGIAATTEDPGFRTIVMAPKPDQRLGFVEAEYRSSAGLIRSAWRYEGKKWIWDFTVPLGAAARVTLPGETETKTYPAGTYHIER